MALLRGFEVKALLLLMGLTLLSCGASAIRGVKAPPRNVVFNVNKFGARPDGKSDSAAAFMKAWEKACISQKNTTVLIPGGVYVTSEVKFHGPCTNKMTLDVQGSVLASGDAKKYLNNVWFSFQWVNVLEIKGKGMFESTFTPSFIFRQVLNSTIDGMTSRNSKGTNIKIEESKNITFQNVHLFSPLNNRDASAIHAIQSQAIKVVSGYIETGGSCALGDVSMNTPSVTCLH